MKQKLFNLLMFLLLSNSLWPQTVLTVVDIDNNSHEMAISTASRMIFHSDSLTIISGEAGVGAYDYSYSDVKKLFFSSFLNDDKVVEDKQITLYPNPANNYLIIEGIGEGVYQLSIFSMNGTEVIRQLYRQGRMIDISSLNTGCYLVKVRGYVKKFIKK